MKKPYWERLSAESFGAKGRRAAQKKREAKAAEEAAAAEHLAPEHLAHQEQPEHPEERGRRQSEAEDEPIADADA